LFEALINEDSNLFSGQILFGHISSTGRILLCLTFCTLKRQMP
jgi:hypothetical protein